MDQRIGLTGKNWVKLGIKGGRNGSGGLGPDLDRRRGRGSLEATGKNRVYREWGEISSYDYGMIMSSTRFQILPLWKPQSDETTQMHIHLEKTRLS